MKPRPVALVSGAQRISGRLLKPNIWHVVVEYRLSRKAEADLIGIALYSSETFGIERALAYGDGLLEMFDRLAENPEMGVSFALRPGIRKYIYQSHTIFYRASTSRVSILRILHQNMDTLRHL
jgi:toxin ParE1/3/4